MAERRHARICNNNRLDDADITISVPDVSGYPFANALDLANRNKMYRPDGKVIEYEIDLHSFQKNVSFFSILAGSNDYLKISNDAVITIRANSIDFFDGSEPLNVQVPVGEQGIYYDFATDQEQYGVNYRYWRITIDDSLNPNDIEVAYIYLGDHVILHKNIANGFNYTLFDNTQVSRSDSGKIYVRQRPQQVLINAVSVQFISKEDKDNLERCIMRIGRHTPFLFVLDPSEKLESLDFSVKPVYFDRTPNFKQQVRNIYTSSYSVREVL